MGVINKKSILYSVYILLAARASVAGIAPFGTAAFAVALMAYDMSSGVINVILYAAACLIGTLLTGVWQQAVIASLTILLFTVSFYFLRTYDRGDAPFVLKCATALVFSGTVPAVIVLAATECTLMDVVNLVLQAAVSFIMFFVYRIGEQSASDFAENNTTTYKMNQEELLIRARDGDREAGEALIQANSGLVWSVARRFFGRGVDPDDLYQLGCLGFLKAVAGFDLSYGTQFSTYAVPKIAGEIRRFLRDDGTIKVSRSLKERAALIRTARQRLTGTLGREPTLAELSEATALQPEDIAVAETATCATESLQRRSGEDGFALEDVLTEGEMEEKILERIALREAIAQLTDREQMVIRLRYFHGLTQDKTAKILGVSQVQISRIEKKALAALRQHI